MQTTKKVETLIRTGLKPLRILSRFSGVSIFTKITVLTLRRFLIASTISVLFVGMFGFPQYVQAEDTCECYCNIEGKGAKKFPDESTRVTADRCQELCREGGFSVATCAFQPSQKPQYNTMCFKKDECTQQGGVQTSTGSGKPPQPGECKQGMYYCYPNPKTRKEVTLQVSIGDLKVTGDFGEYIASVYKWMLGAGTTIAIVFMMVSGLRWALGGANAEQIGKAKKTITNAITGLILLLSTYLIVFTVNPYLVRLQVPAFPMIKQVSLVGEESCGYLAGVWGSAPYLIKNGAPDDSPYAEGGDPGKGYTLKGQGTNCGSIADVVAAPEGEILESDRTCTFNYCPDPKTRCFSSSGKGDCLSCADLGYGKTPPIEVTQSICDSFDKTVVDGGRLTQVETCTFYRPEGMTTSAIAALTGINVTTLLDTAFCVYKSETCTGKTCENYHSESECQSNLCNLSCTWVVTDTVYNRREAESYDVASCSPSS